MRAEVTSLGLNSSCPGRLGIRRSGDRSGERLPKDTRFRSPRGTEIRALGLVIGGRIGPGDGLRSSTPCRLGIGLDGSLSALRLRQLGLGLSSLSVLRQREALLISPLRLRLNRSGELELGAGDSLRGPRNAAIVQDVSSRRPRAPADGARAI